jgi:hypothetical protein
MFKSWFSTTVLLSFCCLFWTMSCGNSADSKDNSTDTTTEANQGSADAESNAEILHERGLLKTVEDAGYPMFNVGIEFPEKKISDTFLLNAEAIQDLDMVKLKNLIGQYIDFDYTSIMDNAMMDMKVSGKSIYSDEGETYQPSSETKTITGILKDAQTPTAGDLPDQIEISSADGKPLKFSTFISPAMAKINGKKVEAYYEERILNTIVGIKFKQ